MLKRNNIELNPIWLKASITGGLWASIEIIIGSFMHNLRIPLSGTILTSQGIILLVAFYQMWPQKGIIWRAGLICALMKSISPSYILLGPMSGIFFEALMLELGITIFGANLSGFSIGGALALLSTLIHKVFSLLILYGLDIVIIYKNLFYFITKQINIKNADPWALIIMIIIFYILIGIIAALVGLTIGKKTKKIRIDKRDFKINRKKDIEVFKLNDDQIFKKVLLILHLIMIPLGLILINYVYIYISLPLIFSYLLFCSIYYKNSLRRLKKPIFWIQLLIIIIMATIFWKGFNLSERVFDIKGLIVGLKMNLRAIFVIITFSSLCVELRNPLIKEFLFKKGFRNLYLSLTLSFSALPIMMAAMPKPLVFLKNPLKTFAKINLQADEWLSYLSQSPEDK
ncbi:MAG: hypothetical protein JEY97_04365 [Bacteroidales bacterium]|nr:hypothetical protein [Bacteroidales bacterium]